MAGLFIPLDVEYASDEKLIDAGPLGELLFVRALCFCKRRRTDGKVLRAQLATVAQGIPSPLKAAQALVDTGAWTLIDGGWRVTNYLKHNKSADTIAAESARKKAASALANHERWHGERRSLTCPHCASESDPKPDPKPDTLSESTEGETEGQVEGESSAAESEPDPKPADRRPRRERIVDLYATTCLKQADFSKIRSAKLFLESKQQEATTHTELDRWLAEYPHDADSVIVAALMGETRNLGAGLPPSLKHAPADPPSAEFKAALRLVHGELRSEASA